MLDFAYFFYTCAPKSVLDDLDKYLELYHRSLSEFLVELGSDPETVFPLSVLKEHWRKYSKFGLVMANVLFKFMLLSEGESFTIAKNDFCKVFVTPIKNEKLCNERAVDVIMHFIDRNLI